MKGVIKIAVVGNEIKSFDIEIQVEKGEELISLLEALGIKAKV